MLFGKEAGEAEKEDERLPGGGDDDLTKDVVNDDDEAKADDPAWGWRMALRLTLIL